MTLAKESFPNPVPALALVEAAIAAVEHGDRRRG